MRDWEALGVGEERVVVVALPSPPPKPPGVLVPEREATGEEDEVRVSVSRGEEVVERESVRVEAGVRDPLGEGDSRELVEGDLPELGLPRGVGDAEVERVTG